MKALKTLPFLAIATVVPIAYFFMSRPGDLEEIVGIDTWSPNVREIAAAIGSRSGGKFDDARHSQFASMFKQRFRDHQHAVGVKIVSDRLMKVMYAPIITRWDMAQVAVAAHNEAKQVLGQDFQVDVYETYITAPMKKLAEAKEDANGRVVVTFDPKFAQERSQDAAMATRQHSMPTGGSNPYWNPGNSVPHLAGFVESKVSTGK